MKIVKVEFKKFNIPLKEPFAYFTATLENLPYVLVTINTDDGHVGFGEASVAWDVTGETQEGALGLLEYIKPILLNKNFDSLDEIKNLMNDVNIHIYGNSALKAAIEMALLDILGKKQNKPVYKLFGQKNLGYIQAQKVFAFSQKDYKLISNEISKVINSGVKILKFKVGKNHVKEIALLEKVIIDYPKVKIVLDVNQGWQNADKAIVIIKEIEKLGNNILWIEQPILCHDFKDLLKIKKNTSIPIMVDESCHNLFDLENLHLRGAIDLVNIKLAKCSGFFEAKKMVDFCEKNKIGYMLGDMVHSSLGTAANLHAATLGNFITFDTTIPESLKEDPFTGLKFEGYKVFIPQEPGLGVKKNTIEGGHNARH